MSLNGSDTMKAALWMIGAIASFTSMAVAGRIVGADFDTFEIMLYRSLVGILIVAGLLSLNAGWRRIGSQRLGLHAIRNLAHFIGQNLWFYALGIISLSQVFALEFTTPIWVIVLSPLLLKEPLKAVSVLAAGLGFVGILIVTSPNIQSLNLGVAAAASCAIAFALSAIFTRKLTRTEPILIILFYLTVMQAAFGLICAGYDGAIAVPSVQNLPLLVLIGCAGLSAHFCLTSALALAPATIVSPIDFARLPVIAVIGALFFDEPLSFSILIGATLIFLANWMNIAVVSRG